MTKAHLSDYRIAFDPAFSFSTEAALFLRRALQEKCDLLLPLAGEEEFKKEDRVFIIGPDSAEIFSPLPYGSCRVLGKERSVKVEGSDLFALTQGVSYLVSRVGADGSFSPEELSQNLTLQERSEYGSDPEAFFPAHLRHLPAASFPSGLEEKRRVLRCPKERPFVIAHRGEHSLYPENSLEGALSAWRCGADAVEVDIQRSADGVWVCMHDADLTRVTDAAGKIKKEGYPHSTQLSDWTLEQLRTLRLRDRLGDLTPFPIPTFEEILRACRGRIFVHTDKRFSYSEDLLPLTEKTGSSESIYLINHIKAEEILFFSRSYAERGIRLDNMLRAKETEASREACEFLLAHPDLTPAVIPRGDVVKWLEEDWALVAEYRERIRFGAWFLREFDYKGLWQESRRRGVGIFMTNHPIELIRALSEPEE